MVVAAHTAHPTQFTDAGDTLIPPLRHSPDVVAWLVTKYSAGEHRRVPCRAPGCTRQTMTAREPAADVFAFCGRECWEQLNRIVRICMCGRAVMRVTDTAMVHSVCSDPCAAIRDARYSS
jgi:hypothetical protein